MPIDRQADPLQAQIRLMTWLSPAFPVGAFAYSGGLEHAIAMGLISGSEGLFDWMDTTLRHGVGWNDAVLFSEAYRVADDADALDDVKALAKALAGSRERHQETLLLGEAFVAAASGWPHPVLARLSGPIAYPVAVGAIAASHHVALDQALVAYLHALSSQMVSVAIRCGLIGQIAGVGILSRTETGLVEIAGLAAKSSLDDLGSAGFVADIASLKHETMGPRLFRS